MAKPRKYVRCIPLILYNTLLYLCIAMTQIAELIDVHILMRNIELADQRKQDASLKNPEEGLPPSQDHGNPRKKSAVFLILLVLILFVILLLPPPFWLLIPILILLYIRWYKHKNQSQRPGPVFDENQPEEPTDASPVGLPTISSTQTKYFLDLSTTSANDQPPKLRNFGNTCFFNAALQAIISTSEFYTLEVMPAYRATTGTTMTYTKQYMIYSKICDVPLEIEVTSEPGPLTVALNRLLKNVLHEIHVSAHGDLLTQLGRRHPRFIRGSQEDSHEALRYILDALKDEEIQPVKRKIESLYPEKNLDGEDKLAKKAYLRMALKVQTAVGKIVEGKFISVTICHECYDVTENVESFFDLSLAIPEKEQFKKKMIGKFSHAKLDHSRVEIKGSSKGERKEAKKRSNKVCPESDCKSSIQSPTSSVLSDKNLAHEKETTTQSDTVNRIQNDKPCKATDIDTLSLDENGNDMHQYKVTDIDSMSTVVGESKQHCCDMQDNFNEKVDDTDLCNSVAMISEDRSVSQSTESDVNLEVKNMLKQMASDKSKSKKGANLAKSQSMETTNFKTPVSHANLIGIEGVDQHDTNLYGASPNSDKQHSSEMRTSRSADETTEDADVTQHDSSKSFTVMLKNPTDGLKCNATLYSQQSVKENGIWPLTPQPSFSTEGVKVKHQDVLSKDSRKESQSVEENGKCHSLQHSLITEEEKGLHQDVQSTDVHKKSQSVEENNKCYSLQNSPFPSTEEVKQWHQDIQCKDALKENQSDCNTSLITEDKDAFQQYLIKNGLNHLAKVKNTHGMDHGLQLSLFLHTDLDVLDEKNKFICQKCSQKKQQESGSNEPVLCRVSKQIMIHLLPPVLILHMKRFEIGNAVTKDCRHISYPEILDMAPYCTTKCLEDVGDSENMILYGLYAVVVHSGGTLHGGHYTAYVKTRPAKEQRLKKKTVNQRYDISYCKKGQWYYTSDYTVMKCSFGDVTRNEAYMLFYEQLPLIDH